MNNFLLSLLVIVSAATGFLTVRQWRREVQRTNIALVAETLQVQAHVSGQRSRMESLRQRVAEWKTLADLAREKLIAAREAASEAAVPPVRLDPEESGFWPANESYFYLSKEHLRHIGYQAFTGDFRVSRTAAQLFSLTPEETAAIEGTAGRLLTTLMGAERSRARQIETGEERGSDQHRKVRFKVRMITQEELQTARHHFDWEVGLILGAERSALFLERAGEEALGFLPGNYPDEEITITLEADRRADGSVNHQLRTQTSNFTMSEGFGFPLAGRSPLWRWLHLFGDRPLLEDWQKKIEEF